MQSSELQYRDLLSKWYNGEIQQEPIAPEHLRDYVIANLKSYAKRMVQACCNR